MRQRLSPAAISALLAGILLVPGCGQALLPGLPGAGGGAPFGALADFPDVDMQVAKARIESNEHGTLVAALPRVKAKPITFLTYKALDNNLGITMPMHLNTLEKAGSSQAVNALAFTDDIGPKNTFKYYIRRDTDINGLTSPYTPADKRGDLNTGSAKTLRRAVQWAFGDYPSKLTWLDVNNHGGGYYGIAQDDRNESIIRLPQLAAALKGASKRKIDVLSFDACLMATAEVAYELRGTARYMVASEDSSFALGMNYDQVLAKLAGKPGIEPDDLARELVLRAQRKGPVKALYTISAIDLDRAEATTRAVDALAVALLAALPAHRQAIAMSLAGVKPFHVSGPDKSDFDHRDLNEVADQLRLRVADPRVKAACQGVKETLFNKNGLVVFARAEREELKVPRGVSVYLPTDGKVDPIYKETAFARGTRWDEFLAALK